MLTWCAEPSQLPEQLGGQSWPFADPSEALLCAHNAAGSLLPSVLELPPCTSSENNHFCPTRILVNGSLPPCVATRSLAEIWKNTRCVCLSTAVQTFAKTKAWNPAKSSRAHNFQTNRSQLEMALGWVWLSLCTVAKFWKVKHAPFQHLVGSAWHLSKSNMFKT